MRRSYDIKILGVAGIVLAGAYLTSASQPCRRVYYKDYFECTKYNPINRCHVKAPQKWSAVVCSENRYFGSYSSGGGSSYESGSSRGGFGKLGRFFGRLGG